MCNANGLVCDADAVSSDTVTSTPTNAGTAVPTDT